MTDSILIIGGGIAGINAAIKCARSGARVVVVEQDAIVGGRLAAAMTQRSSVGESLDGASVPKLETLATTAGIEFLTLAELDDIEGRPGNFEVSIRQRARFVTEDCTRCNHCRPVCPVVRPNEHDAGLNYRKAIFAPLPETLPQEFVIDIDACLNTPPNYLPCNRCTEVCDDDAIRFDVPLDQVHKRHVGAIIVATGLEEMSTAGTGNRFFGEHPDIVTDSEMERLLTAPGPTGGFAAKPSNEEYPSNALFVLDEFAPFPEHTASSQIGRLSAQDVKGITLLVTTQPGDEDLDRLAQALPESVTVRAGLLQKVEFGDDQRLAVTYAEFSGSSVPEERFDMVVLLSSPQPATGLQQVSDILGIELNERGFVVRSNAEVPCATSRPGVYVAGCAGGLAHLGEVVQQVELAAAAALSHLDPRLLGGQHDTADAGELLSAPPGEAELRARLESVLTALLEKTD